MVITVEDSAEMRKLFNSGISKRAIARKLGISRNTVDKYCQGNTVPWNKKEYNRQSTIIITSNDMRYFCMYCKKKFNSGSFHSLQHTHATMLLENGLDIEYVSKRLGHSSIVITVKTYSNITKKKHDKAVKVLDKIL